MILFAVTSCKTLSLW